MKPPQYPVGVFVCGFMASGNKLLCRMLNRHGVLTIQDHYGRQFARIAEDWRRRELTIRALWPVRDGEANRVSSQRHVKAPPSKPHGYDVEFAKQSRQALTALGNLGIPILPVSYTRLCREPEVVGLEVASFLGVPWLGWGEEIVDGDAKYRNGAPDRRTVR